MNDSRVGNEDSQVPGTTYPSDLHKDTTADKVFRFGCGVIVGGLVTVSGLVAYSMPGVALVTLASPPGGEVILLVGVPLAVGVAALLGGNRLIESCLEWLRKLV
ncbi:MAG: hypothetical protein AB7O37_15440 [Vicinamibacteria bacterium]